MIVPDPSHHRDRPTERPTPAGPSLRAGRAFVDIGAPVILIAASLGIWEITVRVLSVPEYLMPPPSSIGTNFGENHSLLLHNAWVTLEEVLFGFGIAVIGGLAIGVLLHVWPLLRRALYPILIGSQTIPIVVIAPILVILLGFNIWPKLTIVALLCFFPIVVSTVDGLRSVEQDLKRMMLTLDASRFAIFKRVEFPWALPSVFSGIRIAATYAAVGAVFGEWAGASSGLGYLILQSTPSLDTARIFAALLVLTVMALALFLLVSVAERLVVPWAGET